jgi:hypothetical protein
LEKEKEHPIANRIIPVETKVKVMQECLRLVDVEEVAAPHGLSPRSIYGWYATKIQPALAEVLVNARLGSTPAPTSPVATPPVTVERVS